MQTQSNILWLTKNVFLFHKKHLWHTMYREAGEYVMLWQVGPDPYFTALSKRIRKLMERGPII